ncbi:MAG: nucleotidyltransferase family protein [Actinomycetota bacterium]
METPGSGAAVEAALRSMAVDVATVEAFDRLRRAGIDAILLKGPAISRWLYDDESERPYVDCDLLVAPDDQVRAEDALNGLGYRRMGLDAISHDRPHHAITLRRDDGLAIDLHHTFVGVDGDDRELWRELSARTETMDLAGAEVTSLAPAAKALVVALHAAKDGARSARVREDIRRAIERLPHETWREATRIAERIGAVPGLVAGLRRSEEGPALAIRLGLPDVANPDTILRETAPPPMTAGVNWLMDRGDLRSKMQVAIVKVFPSPEFLRAWSPLARRGHLGLALAYVWRPIWALWHAFPATIAATRARRRARASRSAAGKR